jgi:hypothetical protein
MVAAGCELRARFTGYESQALSLDFILVAARGRGECRERRVARCQACGNMLATVLILVAAGHGERLARDLILVAPGLGI